jgi:hypothetical protein
MYSDNVMDDNINAVRGKPEFTLEAKAMLVQVNGD